MLVASLIRRAGLAALLAAFSSFAPAQAQNAPAVPPSAYEPHSFQAGKATFIRADIFESDFSEASVISMFLPTEINLKLRPKILALKPGTRIVSNSFAMADWKADKTAALSSDAGCDTSWCTALLWSVPAHVAGTHKIPQGELTLKQQFQMLSGTLTTEGKTFALEGKVRGEEITFKSGGREYRGRMNGKSLELR